MRVTLPRERTPGMPRFADVLKSREVEDPVNLWLHRPLAYAFCRLVYRTSITPNQITLLAILLGLLASVCWVVGTERAMVWGGALLWSSAIMDGADGILARARNIQSAFGRALDGSADWIVGLSSVLACVYHLYQTGTQSFILWLAIPTALLTVLQFNLFDFYKEAHLHLTRQERRREGHNIEEVERLCASDEVRTAAWYIRWSMVLYADYTRLQNRIIDFTNPNAHRLLTSTARTPRAADVYRKENRGAMQCWKALSTAPHAYLFAIFGMLDRLDLYILFRLSVMSAIMLIAFALQHSATERTLVQIGR